MKSHVGREQHSSFVFSYSCPTGLSSCGQNHTCCWPEPCCWNGASSLQSKVLRPVGAFQDQPSSSGYPAGGARVQSCPNSHQGNYTWWSETTVPFSVSPAVGFHFPHISLTLFPYGT